MPDSEPAERQASATPDSVDLNNTGREVFSVFYKTNFTPLTVFLLLHGARLADAVDVAQDAMIEVYGSWDRVRHHRAWVYRVASKNLGRRTYAVREDPVAVVELGPLLSHDVEEWEEQQDVIAVLATLPTRQRQIMAWTLSGYGPSEIASELTMTPEAVRANLKKARRSLSKLVTQLQRQHDVEGGGQ